MATILNSTIVNGKLTAESIEALQRISGSLTGSLEGTASYAVTASHAENIASDVTHVIKDLVVSNSLHVKGDSTVDGNLTVKGDLTYMGTQDLRVKDKQIEIGYVESGSTPLSPEQADGAGIIIGNSGSEVASILYRSADRKIVVSNTIAGLIDSASEAVHAIDATHADAAAKVDHTLTVKGDGIAAEVVYDGSQAKTVTIDMTALLAGTRASASAALTAFSESQAVRDAAQDTALANTASAIRSELSASVAEINDTIGEVPAGSTVVEMIEAASSASTAETDKINAELGDKSVDSPVEAATVWGAIEEVADSVSAEATRATQAEEALSSSLASHVNNYNTYVSNQAQKDADQDAALATEVSRSQAAEKVLTDNLATEVSRSQAAEKALSGSLASHVDAYNTFVNEQNQRDADQDAALAATASAIRGELNTAKTELSSSMHSLSGSVAATTLNLSSSLAAEVDRATKAEAAIFASASAYSQSAASALNSFSASQAQKDAAQDAALAATASALRADFEAADENLSASLAAASSSLAEAIEELAGAAEDAYVKHAGDEMTGELRMINAPIGFGTATGESKAQIVYNAELNTIEFVFA